MNKSKETARKRLFNKENYDRLAVNVYKGNREQLKAIAIQKGYRSLNAYIVALIERDSNLKLMGVESPLQEDEPPTFIDENGKEVAYPF